MAGALDAVIGHVKGEAGGGLVFIADEEDGLAGLLLELVAELLDRRRRRSASRAGDPLGSES